MGAGKIDPRKIDAMREARGKGLTVQQIADEFGCSTATVSRRCTGVEQVVRPPRGRPTGSKRSDTEGATPKKRRWLDAAIIAEIRDQRRRGLAYAEIGNNLGIGTSTAFGYASDIAIDSQAAAPHRGKPSRMDKSLLLECRKHREDGMSYQAIAALVGMSATTLFRWLTAQEPEKHTLVPVETIAAMREAQADGKSYRELAECTGLSQSTVRSLLKPKTCR